VAIAYDKMKKSDAEFAKKHFRCVEKVKEAVSAGHHVKATVQFYPNGDIVPVPAAKPSKPRGPSEPEKEFHARALAYRLFQAVNYQPNPFLLEGNTSYQPDFNLLMQCGLWIIVETKGRKVRGEGETRLKLRQCSERYPDNVWWLARWHPRLPWKVQEVVNGVIKRKPIVVDWLNGGA
jgi:hypothetical protein